MYIIIMADFAVANKNDFVFTGVKTNDLVIKMTSGSTSGSNASMHIGTVVPSSNIHVSFTPYNVTFGGSNVGLQIENNMFMGKTLPGFDYQITEFPMTTTSSNFATAVIPGNYVLSSSPEGNSGSTHGHYTYMAFNRSNGDYAVSYNAVINYYTNANNSYTGPSFTSASGSNYYGEWIQLEIPQSVVLKQYSITAPGISYARAPNIFTLLGSSDNTTWNLIDTQTGVSWTANQTKTFTLSTPPLAYKYFRVVLFKHNGDAWIGFNELYFVSRIGEATGVFDNSNSPSFSFSNSSNTGMYEAAVNTIGFTMGGSNVVTMSNGAIVLNPNGSIVSFANGYSRNRVLNGDMMVNQRAVFGRNGLTGTSQVFACDCWHLGYSF
jgi:hypothetical protein